MKKAVVLGGNGLIGSHVADFCLRKIFKLLFMISRNRNSYPTGHYVRTPYAYQPKLGRKYVSPMHIDLGQGLLQLIDEVQKTSK